MRMLVRGAKPGRAFLGGQGLDVLTHSTDRTVKYRRILSNSGKFQRGTQEWALDNWVKESGGDPEALRLVLETFVHTPLEALGQITVPTLVIAGEEDKERASGDKLAAAIPNGRYVSVPGNHMTAFPGFVSVVADFIASPR